jgi:hypothetical protein
VTGGDGVCLPMVWQVEGQRRGSLVRDIARGRPAEIPLTYCTPSSGRRVLDAVVQARQCYLTDSQFISEGNPIRPLAPTTHRYLLRVWGTNVDKEVHATIEITVSDGPPTSVQILGSG